MSIDIWVESAAAPIGCLCINLGRFAGIVWTELDSKFEEAIFVWGFGWADDERLDMADVGVLARNCDGLKRSAVF